MNINNINTFSHNQIKDQSELIAVIPPHLGSNGHEVSIHISRHAHVAVAEVRIAQDKRFILPQTSILNGLTSQPVRLEEIQSIARNNSNAFVAVYLPETAKVYIWPRIQAAGIEKHTYIVTGSANIFEGKARQDVEAYLTSSRLIPGTNKAFNSVERWEVLESNAAGKAKKWGAENGAIKINYDGGAPDKRDPSKIEPPHIDIYINAKESHTNRNGATKEYTKPYAYKFPIDPKEPNWARMIRDGDFKSTSKLPIHDPAPPPETLTAVAMAAILAREVVIKEVAVILAPVVIGGEVVAILAVAAVVVVEGTVATLALVAIGAAMLAAVAMAENPALVGVPRVLSKTTSIRIT